MEQQTADTLMNRLAMNVLIIGGNMAGHFEACQLVVLIAFSGASGGISYLHLPLMAISLL